MIVSILNSLGQRAYPDNGFKTCIKCPQSEKLSASRFKVTRCESIWGAEIDAGASREASSLYPISSVTKEGNAADTKRL